MRTVEQLLALAKDVQTLAGLANPIYFLPDELKKEVAESVSLILEMQARRSGRDFFAQQEWILEVGRTMVADIKEFTKTLDDDYLAKSSSLFAKEELCDEANAFFNHIVTRLATLHPYFSKYESARGI